MKPEFHSIPYQSDSSSILYGLSGLKHLAALESASPTHPNGRWSILSADPIEYKTLSNPSEIKHIEREITSLMSRLPSIKSELPFTGGVIGLLSYEHGESHLEKTRSNNESPLAALGLYTWAFVLDHRDHRGYFVYWPEISNTNKELLLNIANNLSTKPTIDEFKLTQPITPKWSKFEYLQRFDKVKQYLNNGDCYQINLTQAFQGRYLGDTIEAYNKIKNAAKAPYATYFDLGDHQLASASPELFLEFNHGVATTKPIKGTRPRSENKQEDARLKKELESSVKDRAENIMIVDLLRNDLSKHGKNVRVPKLCEIESFETVHHLVSTVTAKIEPENYTSALIDAFPGGSITGAPKTRAMEIIEELEDFNRRFYCGSCFVISCNLKATSNILIRSFVFDEADHAVTCWAGGGIVADSDGDEEYQESLDKISKLIQALS